MAVINYTVFKDGIDKLRKDSLLREIRDRASPQGRVITVDNRQVINFGSNDYLGLAGHPRLLRAAKSAMERFGVGAGASRLLAGGCPLHAGLERKVAQFKGTEAALLFSSGYSANTGIIPALAGSGDAVFSDELNHASLIDGCRLSRAVRYIYRHGDTAHLEGLLRSTMAARKLIVTDTVFSMDGEMAPIGDIHRLAEEHGALLYLDDSHATGVLGGGRGALSHLGMAPQAWVIQMGTFSKALGSFGAFAAGSGEAVKWLMNSARSFMFSTAPPPASVAASGEAIDMLTGGAAPIERLWANQRKLLDGLRAMGLDTGKTVTPIIPVMTAGVEEALRLSARLFEEGFYAPAVRPPTVSGPRLRLTVTAAHTEEDIEGLLRAIKDK